AVVADDLDREGVARDVRVRQSELLTLTDLGARDHETVLNGQTVLSTLFVIHVDDHGTRSNLTARGKLQDSELATDIIRVVLNVVLETQNSGLGLKRLELERGPRLRDLGPDDPSTLVTAELLHRVFRGHGNTVSVKPTHIDKS